MDLRKCLTCEETIRREDDVWVDKDGRKVCPPNLVHKPDVPAWAVGNSGPGWAVE